jgi:hypothetical protein
MYCDLTEEELSGAEGNRESPRVKALLDRIVGPLTSAYIEDRLDERTRIAVIKFIADSDYCETGENSKERSVIVA